MFHSKVLEKEDGGSYNKYDINKCIYIDGAILVNIINVSFVRPFRMDYTSIRIPISLRYEKKHTERDTVTWEMRIQNVVDSFLIDRYLISKGRLRRFAVTKNNFSLRFFVSLLRIIALWSLSSILHASPVANVHNESLFCVALLS